jgi:hypothetical protein
LEEKMHRREFLKNIGLGMGGGLIFIPNVLKGDAKNLIKNIPATRVVQIHNPSATNWDFSSGYYGDYVNQGLVDAMMDRGVCELTGLSDPVAAWQRIMSTYQSGDKIAVRVNFNNCMEAGGYSPTHNMVDSIIETTNSIISGLTRIGVPATNIWVYDASRVLPNRFTSGCLYSGVKFYDYPGQNGNLQATFNSSEPTRIINFSNSSIPSHEVTDVLINAQHLINVPLLKAHSTGVSGVFKLHLGTINGPYYDDIHPYLYDLEKNPLVDIFKNPHVGPKTRLIVSDGLFGGRKYNAVPEAWSIFGNKSPNTLFFSLDPVALDTVMQDLLHVQWPTGSMPPDDHNHLHCAFRQGLGIHEHRDRDGRYSQIDWIKVEL